MAPQAATLLPFAATIPVRRELWQRDAECRGVDPELFFPDRGARITEALAACERCTVRAECLDYALRTHQDHRCAGGAAAGEERAQAVGRFLLAEPGVDPGRPHAVT